MTKTYQIEPSFILSLDTTQSALCLALIRGAEVLASVTDNSGLPHSQRLFPLLDELLKNQALAISEIDLLAVNVGPGSFTGLRVGIAAVKGLAATLGKPAMGVSAFDALAQAAGVIDVPVIALINAAKGEMYCGVRQLQANGAIRPLREDCVRTWEQLRIELQSQFGDSEVVWAGSGATANEAELALITPRGMLIVPPNSLAPVIGTFAWRRWQAGQLPNVEASYIRLSEAENKLAK
jgi:tRNA threonylcarbamoyladenosine biosynthesis protein TsaB